MSVQAKLNLVCELSFHPPLSHASKREKTVSNFRLYRALAQKYHQSFEYEKTGFPFLPVVGVLTFKSL